MKQKTKNISFQPDKIKGIKEAVKRIKEAIRKGEHIILYGDSDLDGISSVVILEEAIKNLGGTINCVLFPDRETDGYGLNQKALNILKNKAPALLITLDLGICNIKEIDLANKMGFEVIIIDHHQPLEGIPKASIIIDPKQLGDNSSFKGLANVGVTFNLCLDLLGENISENLKNSFLELAALGTIADMVPQINQNKEIIDQGLKSLRKTYRPALKVFMDILGKDKTFEEFLPQITGALNAADSLNFENDSYKLLTSSDEKKCIELAQKLLDLNKQKQEQVKIILQEVERRISKKPEEAIIFEGDPSWRLVLAGPVAANLCAKYGKPVFIYKKLDKESTGSVRAPKGTNLVDSMKTCSDLLIVFGGHAEASGFRLKNENLEKFKDCLTKYFQK